MSWQTAKIIALAVLLPAAGCGHQPSVLAPAAGAATTSMNAAARVDLVAVDGDLYKLMVYNTSGGMMIINRDAFVLQTPTGVIRREPGGISSTYEVPPGGSHDVNLKFKVGDLPPGQQVYLIADPAVQINGQYTGLPPIVLQAR